jgi:amino acid transporter
VNFYGPRHSGSLAVGLAIPTVAVVVILIALSVPHLSIHHLEGHHGGFVQTWTAFVGVILALSGVEAIANLTGVMTLDPRLDAARAASGEHVVQSAPACHA